MTFPTVQSVTSTAFGTASGTHNVSMPATVSAGDLLIVFFAGVNFTANTPSGWSGIGTPFANGGSITICAKAADGSEGGTTVNFSTGASSCKGAALCYRITGWRNSGTLTNDVEGVIGTSGSTSNANPDPSSLNPTNWDVEDTLWIAAGVINASTTVSAAPTNYTNLQSQASGGSGGASTKATVGTAERQNAVASEDPGTFTFGASSTWVVGTVAVRPAGAAAAVTPNAELPQVIMQAVKRAAYFFRRLISPIPLGA